MELQLIKRFQQLTCYQNKSSTSLWGSNWLFFKISSIYKDLTGNCDNHGLPWNKTSYLETPGRTYTTSNKVNNSFSLTKSPNTTWFWVVLEKEHLFHTLEMFCSYLQIVIFNLLVLWWSWNTITLHIN